MLDNGLNAARLERRGRHVGVLHGGQHGCAVGVVVEHAQRAGERDNRVHAAFVPHEGRAPGRCPAPPLRL